MTMMQSLSNAIILAYKVEESSRIANNFYTKLIAANEKFTELVVETDFQKDVRDTFTADLQIEKIEENIAQREESAGQATKSLFIKTGNVIQNAIGSLQQHMQYLKNNIMNSTDRKPQSLKVI